MKAYQCSKCVNLCDYDDYSARHDGPQCRYNEEPIEEDFASKCHMFVRSDKICFDRTWEDADENLKEYKEKCALEV